MSEPNTGQAVAAAGAGGTGMFVALFAGAIWFGAYFAAGFAFFSTPELGLAERLLAYLAAPVFLAAACLLPARVLGASWRLASLVFVGVSIIASAVVGLSGFALGAISFAFIATPGVAALVVAVATGADPAAIPALVVSTGVLVITAVAMLSAEVFVLAVFINASAWALLPGAAGLFQPPAEPDATSGR